MNYTVLWKPEAERQLATICTRSANRNLNTDSSRLIDKTLGVKPEEVGESREGGFRILLEPPLGVIYTVSEGDRKVDVVAVWSFERESDKNDDRSQS